MTRKSIINVLKMVLAVALIAYVINTAGGWDEISARLSGMDRRGWALGLGCLVLANVLALYRWHLLMACVGLNSTPWLAIRIGWIGVFFNNVVPGLTGGDLIKALYITRENPSQRTRAVVSVIVDRFVGIVALAVIAGLVIPLDFLRFQEAAWGIYGFLAAAGLGGALLLSRRAKARLRQILKRPDDGNGNSLLSKIDAAVSLYRPRMVMLTVAMFMSFGVHLLIILGLSLFGNALADGQREAIAAGRLELAAEELAALNGADGAEPSGAVLAAAVAEKATLRTEQLEALADVSIIEYCSVVPIIMIISALPIAPAGWGVGETAFKHFFTGLEVTEADSVSLSFTYRITTLLISLLGGVFLLLDRKRVREVAASEA